MRPSTHVRCMFFLTGLLSSAQAISACLNPFGCTPKTREECLLSAGEAKTQVAAKAMLSSCNDMPSERTTQKNCAALSASWISHMKNSNGNELKWGKTQDMLECTRFLGFDFNPKQWVTKTYCESNMTMLREAADKIDPETGDTKAMRKVKQAHPEWSSLSADQIAGMVHRWDYPDLSREQVAKALGATYPKDVRNVYLACVLLPGRLGQGGR